MRTSRVFIAICLIFILFNKAALAQSKADFFQKPWETVSENELNELFKAIDLDERLGVPASWLSVAQQDLSWSPEARLIRIYGGWQPKGLFIYYLRDKSGKYSQLKGKSPTIHAHNKAYPPKITTKTVKDYLWFFGFFVRGKEGPFLPIETARDTFFPKGITGGDYAKGYQKASDLPRPIKCRQASGVDAFDCDVLIMYSNAMFEAKMAVEHGGMVRMKSDKPVAADMNRKIFAPITLASVETQFKKPTGPLGGSSSKNNAPQVSGLQADAQRVYDGLIAGKKLKLDDRTTPFLAGMAGAMLQNCGMPRNIKAKVKLQTFTASSTVSSLMGSEYSNKDLGKTFGSAFKQQSLLTAGAAVTNQLGCGPALDRLGERIAEIIDENSASDSVFVDSCAAVHGRASCTCLANLARPVMPDISRRMYHRSDIAELIQRNPMTALMVSFSCGIVNY